MLEDLKPNQRTKVFEYLFSCINKSTLKKEIADKDVYKYIDDKVLKNGYVLKNCKAYLYAKHIYGPKVSYKLFGIEKQDAHSLRYINLELPASDIKPLTLKGMDQLISCVDSKEFRTYIGKYISKKMLFLIHSYGVDRTELVSELQLAGLYAILKKYPFFKSGLHAKNTAKTAIHNRGINLIMYYTRKKRQRLLQEQNSYQAAHLDVSKLQIPYVDVQANRNELHSCFNSLSSRCTKKAGLFLKLATGEYDEQFSKYLSVNNSDLVDSCSYNSYLSHVQSYLGVSRQQVTTFLDKIKRYL